MFRDFSRNNPTVFRAVQHQTVHVHFDDNKSEPTWWQSLLIALAILIGGIGLIVFDNWIESPENLAIVYGAIMKISSFGLIALGIWYAISFVKSRALCQICNPSTGRGW